MFQMEQLVLRNFLLFFRLYYENQQTYSAIDMILCLIPNCNDNVNEQRFQFLFKLLTVYKFFNQE